MMSDYDRHKTTPPPEHPVIGQCMNCGTVDNWVRGMDEIDVCGNCHAPAIEYRYETCDCGATTAWGCKCDERREA